MQRRRKRINKTKSKTVIVGPIMTPGELAQTIKKAQEHYTMKEIKVESGIEPPPPNSGRPMPEVPQAPDEPEVKSSTPKSYSTAEKEAEIAMLKLKLELAEARAKLAELKAGAAPVNAEIRKLDDPLTWEGAKAFTVCQARGIPEMPPVDPAAGDKTPDVVRWFKRYWPEEYALRYKGRKTVLDDLRRSNPGAVNETLTPDEAREARAPDFSPCKGEEGLDLTARSFTV